MRSALPPTGLLRRTVLSLVASASAAACNPSLPLPERARVGCVDDGDCPTDLVCARAAHQCVDPALDDGDGLRLQSITATSSISVVLVFDESVVLSDAALSDIGITPSLTVLAVERDPDDDSQVVVQTSQQRGQQAYDVTLTGLTDIFGNALAPDSTTGSFTGFGPGPDGAPPSFIFPLEGEQFALGDVSVLWSGLALVEGYFLEVWTEDPRLDGAQGPAATYSTVAPATTVDITLAAATTHWLRLRSDATRAGEYAIRRIEVVDDTIYVHCPAGETCDDASTGGNLASPRRSVARAIADAQRLGATRVLVASRGVASGGTEVETYDETFDVHADLTLRGGYDPTFEEATWSPMNNRTIVASTEATVMRCTAVKAAVDGALLVEGLELVSSSPNPSSVVSFVNCDDGVTLRGNVIRNEGTSDSRTGVFMQSSKPDGAPGPAIEDNQIHSGLGVQVVGVNTAISGNHFFAGGIPEAGGVFVTGGLVEIIDNTIDIVTHDQGGFVAIYVLQLNPFNGSVRVEGNTMTIAQSNRASDGVILVNADGVIAGNTITTGAAPFTVGVLLESNERINESRSWLVTDNVFDIGVGNGAYGTSAAVYISDRGDSVSGLIARNRGTVAGLEATSDGVAAGIYVGSESASGTRSELTFHNNAFDVGAAPLGIGAGARVYLLGALPKLTFVHNTLRYTNTSRFAFPATPTAGGLLVEGGGLGDLGMTLVNNLFVGPGGQAGPGIYSQESAPLPVMDHNLAVGVERFAHYPNVASPINDATGSTCNTLFGDGNLGPASAALDDESDLLLDGLAPTAGSPDALRFGGINSLVVSCGAANDVSCGGVGDDVLSGSRTCAPPSCTSIGAYEVD